MNIKIFLIKLLYFDCMILLYIELNFSGQNLDDYNSTKPLRSKYKLTIVKKK